MRSVRMCLSHAWARRWNDRSSLSDAAARGTACLAAPSDAPPTPVPPRCPLGYPGALQPTDPTLKCHLPSLSPDPGTFTLFPMPAGGAAVTRHCLARPLGTGASGKSGPCRAHPLAAFHAGSGCGLRLQPPGCAGLRGAGFRGAPMPCPRISVHPMSAFPTRLPSCCTFPLGTDSSSRWRGRHRSGAGRSSLGRSPGWQLGSRPQWWVGDRNGARAAPCPLLPPPRSSSLTVPHCVVPLCRTQGHESLCCQCRELRCDFQEPLVSLRWEVLDPLQGGVCCQLEALL